MPAAEGTQCGQDMVRCWLQSILHLDLNLITHIPLLLLHWHLKVSISHTHVHTYILAKILWHFYDDISINKAYRIGRWSSQTVGVYPQRERQTPNPNQWRTSISSMLLWPQRYWWKQKYIVPKLSLPMSIFYVAGLFHDTSGIKEKWICKHGTHLPSSNSQLCHRPNTLGFRHKAKACIQIGALQGRRRWTSLQLPSNNHSV